MEGMYHAVLERFVRTLVAGVAHAKAGRPAAVVTKDDVHAALARSPFAGMLRGL